ncbi:MAG: hypothetical protein U0Q18_08140 [Bryobacteraceae bacterium]
MSSIPVPAPSAGSPVPAAAPRLVSLDAFRGFTMFWIVQGKGIVEGLRALGSNPLLTGVTYQLDHSVWQGLRYYDCIWPSSC